MFELTQEEFKSWSYQIDTFNPSEKMGLRFAPLCFTEQGVDMLSIVLNSERAINANIQIIRIFTRMRKLILNQKKILLKFEKLEQSSLKNKEDIKLIFSYLKKLITGNEVKKRKQIGFKKKLKRRLSPPFIYMI